MNKATPGDKHPTNTGRNHVKSRRPLVIGLTTCLAMYGVLGLQVVGFDIPLLRIPIGLSFLILVPGYLALRILKVSQLGRLEEWLYSVGLGVALLMFAGVLANSVYPLVGVSRPISTLPIVFTVSLIILGLAIARSLASHEVPIHFDRERRTYPIVPILFLLLLPLLSILGTHLASQGNIFLLLILFPLLCSVPILAVLGGFLPERCYSLAVFSTSLSLLLQTTLVSNHLWGWDIQFEYYLANLVAQQGVWNPALPFSTNGMLSVVILAPSVSVVTGLDIAWTLKLVYPILFSLVPVVVFAAARQQFDSKIALLGALFLSYLFIFYTEMIQLARQEVAELFLSLILLALVDGKLGYLSRSVLTITFGASVIVSHYGTSYLFLLMLVPAWLGLKLSQNIRLRRLTGDSIAAQSGRNGNTESLATPGQRGRSNRLQLGFVLLFSALTVSWYVYVSGSSAFIAVTQIGSQIVRALQTDLLNSQASQGFIIIAGQTPSLLHTVTKWFHFVSQVFVLFGLVLVLLRRRIFRGLRPEFLGISIPGLALWVGAVSIPYFASAINTTRIYQLTLLALAPFFVLGGITFFGSIFRLLRKSRSQGEPRNPLKLMAAFLTIFLLLNCGWAYQVANDSPTSLSMNPQIDTPRYDDRDVAGAVWLAASVGHAAVVADANRYQILLGHGVPFEYLYASTSENLNGECLFVGTYNAQQGILLAQIPSAAGNPLQARYVSIGPFSASMSVVYDNGGSKVLC